MVTPLAGLDLYQADAHGWLPPRLLRLQRLAYPLSPSDLPSNTQRMISESSWVSNGLRQKALNPKALARSD